MHLIYHSFFQIAWTSFGLCWLLTAFRVKKIKEPEARLAFFTHHGLSVLAFVMIFADWFRMGLLGWALWP